MLSELIKNLRNPEEMGHFFASFEGFIIVLILIILWRFSTHRPESNFKVRESERTPEKMKKSPKPLELEGIRIDALPHEVLGLPLNATEHQIQQSYRALMKRYHPDQVGRPGTPEWTEAQKIAEAINAARSAMMMKVPKSKP